MHAAKEVQRATAARVALGMPARPPREEWTRKAYRNHTRTSGVFSERFAIEQIRSNERSDGHDRLTTSHLGIHICMRPRFYKGNLVRLSNAEKPI